MNKISAGENISGEGVILFPETAQENAKRYAHTPVYDPNIIPRGRKAHVGEGIWMARLC